MPTDGDLRLQILIGAAGSSSEQIGRTLRAVVTQAGSTVPVSVLSASHDVRLSDSVKWTSEPGDDLRIVPGVEHILWIDAGAEPARGALERLIEVARRFQADLVYADGASAVAGRRRILRRPDFSPLRALEQDYLGDLILLSASSIAARGSGMPASRLDMEQIAWTLDPRSAVHIPEVLARRDDTPPRSDPEARRAALTAHLARVGVTAEVLADPQARIRFTPPHSPLVSIIIPTRGGSAQVHGSHRVLVVEAVRSIVDGTTYPSYEIVVVADDATPQKVIDELLAVAGERLVLVRWSERFNFSGKINRGASRASGEYLVLLNDDVELISHDWLETLVGLVQQAGVGMVGAHLLFEDGRLQHAGHFYRARGADHIALNWLADDDDGLGALHVDREVSGVTAACSIISRELFDRVGGLSTLLPGNYNDVDLSFKVRSLGRRIVWTPWAKLFHFESQTRDATATDSELTSLRARWGTRMEVDSYWPEDAAPVNLH